MLKNNPSAADESNEQYVDAIDDRPLVPRRSMDDNEMDITPMIDMTFLLLIFFLVGSRMDQDAPVELPPARHGTAVAIKSSVIVTIAKGSDDAAEVYMADGKSADRLLDNQDLDAQSAAITQYVEEELAAGNKDNVLIKAEKGVRHRDVARVTRAVSQADKDLYVAVLEIQ
jgi:biopolymer transport protein ExbD